MACSNTIGDFYQGNDVAWNVYVKQNGVALDLSSAVVDIRFVMKSSVDDPNIEALINKSATAVDASVGHSLITLDNADTDVTPGNYYYDLSLEIDNFLTTVIKDRIEVLQPVLSP